MSASNFFKNAYNYNNFLLQEFSRSQRNRQFKFLTKKFLFQKQLIKLMNKNENKY